MHRYIKRCTLALHANGLTKKGLNHDLTDVEKGLIMVSRRAGLSTDAKIVSCEKGSNLKYVQ